MRLASVELYEIALPLVEPFSISSGTVTERRVLLVELTTVDGAVAWSECVAMRRPNYSPETLDTAWLALTEWLVPELLVEPWELPGDVAGRLDEGVRGHRMAKATLEMGCWGLDAMARGESLARRLGGVRTQVETGISLGIQPTIEDLVVRVEKALEAGYRRVKLKVRPGMDVEPVRAVRAAVGDEVMLTVDANAAYTLDDLPVLEALDGFGLAMIEQPLAWDDLRQHAELQRALATPLCLDESITSVERAEEMIERGSGRIVNIKPGRVGGLSESIAIHDLCRDAGVPVWCGGMLESGIGRAYNVALASLPGFDSPGDLSPSARYWAEDVVAPEWTMSPDGRVAVPRDAAGLGVEVRRECIEALAIRRTRIAT